MKRYVVLAVLVLILVLGAIGTAQAITNGTLDSDNTYPYVGALVVAGEQGRVDIICSGMAISSKLFVTAAHCFGTNPPKDFWVTFAPKLSDMTLHKGRSWNPHPNFKSGKACGDGEIAGTFCQDVAVVEFSPRLDLDEYPSLPPVGLVDTLQNGTNVDIVGYGDIDFNDEGDCGKKRPTPCPLAGRQFAQADLISSGENIRAGNVKLTANQGNDKGGVCFGDSGGPALLDDLTTVSVNSFVLGKEDTGNGVGPTCDGVTYAQRLDTQEVLDFITSFEKGKK